MIPQDLAKWSFKRHLAATGRSDGIRFHDLRRSAATLMLSRGVHPKVVSEMLGHADISITLRQQNLRVGVKIGVTPQQSNARVRLFLTWAGGDGGANFPPAVRLRS
jgi:hypothetical protein